MSGIPAKRFLTQTLQECAQLDLEKDYRLAAQLRFMCESYPVNDSASSDDKTEYTSTATEDTSEFIGLMRVFEELARSISLGSCLSCFGH